MKKIKLIATGGTISAQGKDRLDMKDYQTGVYSGEDLLQKVPEINEIAEVAIVQLANFSSTCMKSSHWLELQAMVNRALNEDSYDGVVVTHGTNTLEETAYFLHLTMNSNKPVVCVGAQRPSTAIGSDAISNLFNAIRVAVDEKSTGKGVLVVSNNDINCAREVAKISTYRLETFQSGELGFLGYIDPDDTIHYYRSPARKHTVQSIFAKTSAIKLPHVAIVYSYAGVDGDLIRFISNSKKYSGIVIAGTGAGRCSPEESAALKEAVESGMVVVRSRRVHEGRVVPIDSFNEFPCVTADNLSPQKSRILLMLALTLTDSLSDIQEIFNDY